MFDNDYGENEDIDYEAIQQWASPIKALQKAPGGNIMSRRKLMTEKKMSKKVNINIFNTEIKVNQGLEKLMRDSSIEGTKAISNQESLKKAIPPGIRPGFGSLESEAQSAMESSPEKSKDATNRRVRLPPVGSEGEKKNLIKMKRAGLRLDVD